MNKKKKIKVVYNPKMTINNAFKLTHLECLKSREFINVMVRNL